MPLVLPKRGPGGDTVRRADPTPEQIAERAAAIRATWSDAEREERMRCDRRPFLWTLPVCPRPVRRPGPRDD